MENAPPIDDTPIVRGNNRILRDLN
jgi:hypothetical protein